jgi:hypothetical protein
MDDAHFLHHSFVTNMTAMSQRLRTGSHSNTAASLQCPTRSRQTPRDTKCETSQHTTHGGARRALPQRTAPEHVSSGSQPAATLKNHLLYQRRSHSQEQMPVKLNPLSNLSALAKYNPRYYIRGSANTLSDSPQERAATGRLMQAADRWTDVGDPHAAPVPGPAAMDEGIAGW